MLGDLGKEAVGAKRNAIKSGDYKKVAAAGKSNKGLEQSNALREVI